MTTDILIIEQAAANQTIKANFPAKTELINSLLAVEKSAKKESKKYSLANLIGSWNLRFVTGTKKSRKRGGIILGVGKFMPRWLKINLSYESDRQATINTGKVINSVSLGSIKLLLNGPAKFIPEQRILAFDFTYLKLTVLGIDLYRGYIRQGRETEANFQQQKLKDQAFFSYFLIEDNFIAARGRGGGLALWSRAD